MVEIFDYQLSFFHGYWVFIFSGFHSLTGEVGMSVFITYFLGTWSFHMVCCV